MHSLSGPTAKRGADGREAVIRGSGTAVLVLAVAVGISGCGSGGGTSKDLDGLKASYKDFLRLVREHKYDAACEKYVDVRTRRLVRRLGGCKLLAPDKKNPLPTDAQIDSMVGTVDGDRARWRVPAIDDSGTAVYKDDHWIFGPDDAAPAPGSPPLIDIETPDRVVQQGEQAVAAFNAGKQIAPQAGCLACHKIGDSGNDGPGSPLTHIGAKRSRQAIRQALIDPVAPMPSFKDLPQDRLDQLVAFLSQLK